MRVTSPMNVSPSTTMGTSPRSKSGSSSRSGVAGETVVSLVVMNSFTGAAERARILHRGEQQVRLVHDADDALSLEHRQLRHVVELHPREGREEEIGGLDRHHRTVRMPARDDVA